MNLRDMPIRQKLMSVNLLVSGAVLLLTWASFIAYEFVTLHGNMLQSYMTRAQIIAANSTAALAFQNQADATSVLDALKIDRRMNAACLYDDKGGVFATYPAAAPAGTFPAVPGESGYRGGHLDVFEPVLKDGRRLGTVYLQSNLSALTDRYQAYAWLALGVITASLSLAFLLSRLLQKQISAPILALSAAAQAVSRNRDFSVRAPKLSGDELGKLTDTFNQMLSEIEAQNEALRRSEERFRALIENNQDGIVVSSDQGEALYVSPALTRMLGRPESDFIGKSRKDLVHPDDLPVVTNKMAETLQNPGKIVQARYRLRHQNGSWRWIDMTAMNLIGNPAVGGIIRNIRDITEQLKLEEINRLGESQAIRDIKDYAILMLDAEGRILTWNAGAEHMKGYKASEIAGKPVSIFYTPEDKAKDHPQELMRAAARQGHVEEEGWRVRKDGSRFMADTVITALKNEKGELRGFIKVTRDVTEIRKAQRELQEKTELLDSILRNIGDGVVVANEKGEFILFNQAAERIVGLGPMAGGPEKWTEQYGVFRPDGKTPLPAAENPMARAIRGEATNDVEVFLRNAPNPNGLLITLTGRPLKDGKGAIHGGVVVFHDMTERKKAEEEIKRANDFLNAILENIPNMIFVKEAKELRFVRFNKAGEELLGLKRQEMIGKNDHDFFPKAEAEFFTAKDRQVLAGGKLLDIPEEPIETKSAGKRILHTKKLPILDLDGKPRYLLGISEDITEAKRQEELRLYTRALEVSNKELQDFVFVASHDLQEPLRKIQSFGEFLQEEYGAQLEGNGKDYLERMRSAAGRMQTLINDLLTLTRVTTKAKPFEPTDLSKVLKDVLSDLELRIHEKKAKMEVGPLPTLEADATQMRQLFQNLVGNALKFQKPGLAPVVRVEAEVLGGPTPATGQCRIRVKDNGIGFENRYADQIFKVFERLHGRDEYEGTGIGLAVCRKVAERHGGTITAEGFPGEGAVFTVTLPLQQGRKV